MKYAAIITDLDGTAIPGAMDGMPSSAVIQAAKKYSDEHVLCAATGRSWRHAEPVIKALGLQKPCILSGGAMIVDPVAEKILWQETIPAQTAREIAVIASKFPYAMTYARALVVTEKAPPSTIDFAEDVNTIYILDIEPGADAELIEAMADIEGVTISRAHSWFVDDGIDLHITNREATKEHAVEQLCAILGVDSADVAGVGDGFNDIHLFRAVGHKVAMGNAVPELKAAADEVIGSLDEDGLAKFLLSL